MFIIILIVIIMRRRRRTLLSVRDTQVVEASDTTNNSHSKYIPTADRKVNLYVVFVFSLRETSCACCTTRLLIDQVRWNTI